MCGCNTDQRDSRQIYIITAPVFNSAGYKYNTVVHIQQSSFNKVLREMVDSNTKGLRGKSLVWCQRISFRISSEIRMSFFYCVEISKKIKPILC